MHKIQVKAGGFLQVLLLTVSQKRGKLSEDIDQWSERMDMTYGKCLKR